MAYCRFDKDPRKSNAYVWGGWKYLECTACRLSPRDGWYDDFTTTSRSAMLRHLQEHRQRGFKIPWPATRRLKREIRRFGDEY